MYLIMYIVFFFSIRRRHTRCALVTGVQTCALPILKQTALFPNMVVQMTAIGEESGALDNMLFKVAEFYEEEVSNAVDTLSTLLEPIIMVVLGTLVGGMVVALYLPIFKLAGTF